MSELKVLLTPGQLDNISEQVVVAITSKKRLITDLDDKPYLKLNEFAEWTGFTKPTIRKFVKAGLPVAIVGSQKMYGKRSYIEWLKTKEQ
ncbi:helix-turn-helix domain-containing protein [Lactobacillus reuteri]|nr:helix-turn-helix domain-containing protein [Limosilactobacillus reuteri]